MKKTLALVALTLALVLSTLVPVSPASAQLDGVDYEVVYGPHPQQTIAVRNPTGTDPRAAVLFIHGGCWNGGDRDVWEAKAEELRDAGYITWNMNYRTDAANPWQDITWDVAEAIHHISSDPRIKSLTLIGDSAGGHLALDYAVKNPSALNTVAVISPVTDPHYWRQTSPGWASCFETDFAEGTPTQQPARWSEYSPIKRVQAGLRPPVRTYVYGSGADYITPRSQVDRFYAEVIQHQPIYGAVVNQCQTQYPDHGTRLLPCAWGPIRNFIPSP